MDPKEAERQLNQKQGVAAVLEEALHDLLDGAEQDIINFTNTLAFDSIEAMMLPPERRDAVLAEIVAQVQVVGELNRLRAVNAGWDMVGRIVTVAQKTAIAMLIAAI